MAGTVRQWQAEVTFPGGRKMMFGLGAETEDQAWEDAANRADECPENVMVTEIKRPHLREGYRISDRHRH